MSASIRDKSYAPSDIYWGNGYVRGRCSVCGGTKQHRQAKNPKYFKPYYFRVFEKVDIFRGNDEYLGMICKLCIKEGKLMIVNKFHPNQLTEVTDLVLKDSAKDTEATSEPQSDTNLVSEGE